MAIRKTQRSGRTVLIIDIRYNTPSGEPMRYRRDAQVNSMTAARAEERRLLTELALHGALPLAVTQLRGGNAGRQFATPVAAATFGDAVTAFVDNQLLTKKPSTQRGYREILALPALSELRDVPLSAVGVAELSRLDVALATSGVSTSRRRNIAVVVRSVLRAAVMRGEIDDFPRLPRLPAVGKTVVDAFPIDELPRLLDTATPAARIAFALAAYAGLRAGEIRGLRWSDIQWTAGQIIVRRAESHGVLAAPKSGHERRIPIAEPLRRLLTRGVGDAPVSLRDDGEPWGEHGLRNAFITTTRKMGLVITRFHSLRHLFATELFRRGVAAPVVQALCGHGSLSVTQRYAHAVSDDLRAAIARLA